MSVYDKIFPPRVLTLPNGKQISKPRSRAPLAVVILLALTILSVEVTGFDMGVLVSRIKEFFVILGEMIPPEWDYICLLYTSTSISSERSSFPRAYWASGNPRSAAWVNQSFTL